MVTIGLIHKPFGIHGQVRVESLTDVPGRFESLSTVTLLLTDGKIMETNVTSVRKVHQGYLVSFSACTTPESAHHFRGATIQIPEKTDLPRQKDMFYQFELIGLHAEDLNGNTLGTVEEIMEYPQHHVLIVRNNNEEVLIPANRQAITKVDLDKKIIQLGPREHWDISYAL